MRMLYNIVAGVILSVLVMACEKDLSLYDTPDCRLNFRYYQYGDLLDAENVTDEMRLTLYSFIYAGGEMERDTLWFQISTMGFLSGEERPLALQQIQVEGEENAVPGVHYVAFDDAEYRLLYCVPANQDTLSIPVILLRDASLQEKNVRLKFGFKENEYFKPGYVGLTERVINITDRLAKPGNWGECYMDQVVGAYGEVKHQLMIEWTGEAWDEDYVKEFAEGDGAYQSYMSQWFIRKLDEENAKRLADPEIGEVYREADGTIVDFTPLPWS